MILFQELGLVVLFYILRVLSDRLGHRFYLTTRYGAKIRHYEGPNVIVYSTGYETYSFNKMTQRYSTNIGSTVMRAHSNGHEIVVEAPAYPPRDSRLERMSFEDVEDAFNRAKESGAHVNHR